MSLSKDGCGYFAVLAIAALGIAAARWWLAGRVALAPDEAYYWRWSTSLALSYPDHPPLTAWLIRGGTTLLGESGPLGVRLVGLVGSVISMGLVYALGRALGLARASATAAAVLQSILIAPSAAALIMTPDTPLGLAWLVAELSMVCILRGDERWWWGLGGALGTAVLSKYEGALLLPIVGCFLWRPFHNGLRGKSWHPFLGILIPVLVVAPHFVSELRLGFSAARFQGAHLAGALPQGDVWSAIPLRWLEVISGQAGLLTPLVAVLAGVGVWRARTPEYRVVAACLVVPMAATMVAACFTHPEQNWAAIGHPGAAVLAVSALGSMRHTVRRRRWWWGAVWGSAAVPSLLIHIHLITPILPLPATKDPTARLQGWDALDGLFSELLAADQVLVDNYGLAAELAWRFRRKTTLPPIVAADREPFSPEGRLLILDQSADFGQASAPVTCEMTDKPHRIALRRGDGAVWDTVTAMTGRGCRQKIPK